MSAPVYPLTMPTSPNFVRSEWSIERTVARTTSPFTYAQSVHEYEGAVWTATVTLPPMFREQAVEWQTFFMQLHGTKGTFLMGDPDAGSPRGTINNTIAVNGAHSIGAYDITIDGADTGETIFEKGDYVQFNSGATSQLHMIVEDIASDGSGNATLKVEPTLKVALSNDATISYTNPKGVFRMTSNELGWSADRISTYGISFSCIQAL
tara:strand:+ start:365 stop:988 length:624 start_codon:yes stop_codon:yes gene_type:complete